MSLSMELVSSVSTKLASSTLLVTTPPIITAALSIAKYQQEQEHECVADAVMLTLIRTAKLNDDELQGVLASIADHKITDLAAPLPWNWRHAIPVAGTA